jgi:hypothetical protein
MPHNGTFPYLERWDRVRRQRFERERQQRQETGKDQQQRSESSVGAGNIEALFAKGDQAILGWSATAADYSRFRGEDHHTDADAVQIVLAALNCMKEERDRAISLIHLLVSERKALRSHIATFHRPVTPAHRLYARVGLREDCPEFVLQAARIAY